MRVLDFLTSHPVFRHEEFERFLESQGRRNKKTRDALLAYHVGVGHLIRIQRGLYAVVPRGFEPKSCPVDSYLVAAHLAEDAVLAYHTALQFHGRSYSMEHRFLYLTRHARRPVVFREQQFVPVLSPRALSTKAKRNFGVVSRDYAGQSVRVTSLERTAVDVLARPELGGGWEEIWRSLESVEFLHVDEVVAYALMLKNVTVAARVGLFLEQHREELLVEEKHLARLRKASPRQPCYLEHRQRAHGRGKPGKLVRPWNLIVPAAVLNREWEEMA